MQSLAESSELKDFFDRALPKGESGHVLAMGELHTESQHLNFLRENLPLLAECHNLRAIGLEMAPYMNVFLWAYRDNKLPVPEDMRTTYMEAVFTAYARSSRHAHAQTLAKLVTEALDRPENIRVVACDARITSADALNNHSKHAVLLSAVQKQDANENFAGSCVAVARKLRQNPSALRIMAEKLAPQQRSEIHLLENAWMQQEALALMRRNPAYAARVNAMERMVWDGKSLRIGDDALSAMLFHVAAGCTGNRLSITGLSHITGHRCDVTDGTFDFHMRKLDSPSFPAVKQVSKMAYTAPNVIQQYLQDTGGIFRMRSMPLMTFDPGNNASYATLLSSHSLGQKCPETEYGNYFANPLLASSVSKDAAEVKRRENAVWNKPPLRGATHCIG